jgi:hypothetical protein
MDSAIYNTYDINEIVAKYEVQGKRIWTQVSIENIYGMYLFKDSIPRTFPEVFDHFFDEGIDLREIPSGSYNADCLADAITCYVAYDEYDIDSIMTEISEVLKQQKE